MEEPLENKKRYFISTGIYKKKLKKTKKKTTATWTAVCYHSSAI